MVHLVNVMTADNKEICKVSLNKARYYIRRRIAVIKEYNICPSLPDSIVLCPNFPSYELEKLKCLGGNIND